MSSESGIRDEELLVLGLCRLDFSEGQLADISALKEAVTDWTYFRYLANSHGVAALIYHNLERHELLKGIPDDVVTFLRGALMISMSRNAYNSETISNVLQLLNNENIKVVLLKGLALEISIYGNAGLRQMTDVDILIEPESCLKARAILLNNGFVSLPVKSVFHEFIIRHIGKHLPSLIRKDTSVEIHHELFGGRKNILTRTLYENSFEYILKGGKAYVPGPQIFFLYLVRHLFLHETNNESQLRLYADLVVMTEKYYDQIINYNLLNLASQAGMSDLLAWKLGLLREFWGISFPQWINDYIDRWYTQDSVSKFVFFLKSPKNNQPPDKAEAYRQTIRDIPGLHRKFLYLVGDIFPSVSFMKKRYNYSGTVKLFLYYPHRLGKLIWLVKR